MEEIDSSPLSPNPRKRSAPDQDSPSKKPLNLKGTQFVMPTPPDTEESSDASPTATEVVQNALRAGSPAPSMSTMTSIDDSVVGNPGITFNLPTQGTPGSSSNPPPAKRRKLTPSERLAKTAEKAKKDAEKAERKATREEEKRVEDEKRRQKAEEREMKKREKEQEEQKKLNEKLKKERSQMRLGAFFAQKPGTPTNLAASNGEGDPRSARRKSLSLEPFDAVADLICTSKSPNRTATASAATPERETQASAAKATVSAYHKMFLPYEVPSHSTVAPAFLIHNPDDLAYWQGAFDQELKDPSFQEKVDLGLIEPHAVFDHQFAIDRMSSRGLRIPNVRRLVDQIQGTSQQPIDLTDDAGMPPVQALQTVSRRYLEFHEDVRPAWFGSYTKITSPRTSRKLALNPFSCLRNDTDYGYDSEAEWEEPEEGEDVCMDEDDEADSMGDVDEMDGFLDDEDDALKNKRKMITGDLQPVCTGLCWENEEYRIMQSIEGEDVIGTPEGMHDMKLEFLLPDLSIRSINPFSAEYWPNEMAPPALPIASVPKAFGCLSRPPLQERQNSNSSPGPSIIGAAQGEKGPITSTQPAKRGPKPQTRLLNGEDLEEFKIAVVGSNLGKMELSKSLKLRFPKMTNETIKETLNSMFAPVGPKNDKKWIFVSAV